MENEKKPDIVKKMVEVEKILFNQSKSSRIDEDFNVKQENRKYRKTLEYIGRIKTNNYLDPSIILREERTDDDYHFVCVEGATRVKAIKSNPKIKYLKCSVANAIIGVNEIKPSRVKYEDKKTYSYRTKPIEINFDAPEDIKKQYSKKISLQKSKLPTMGKL